VPSIAGVWNQGLRAVRDALFSGRIARSASWVVVDGYEGSVLVWGASRDEALAAWRAEVERFRPAPPQRPPGPARPPTTLRAETTDLPDGSGQAITIRGPSADLPWPDPSPEHTPAVVIPLDPEPRAPAPWGARTRLVGRFGTTMHALHRRDAGGFTLAGAELFGRIDFDGLDAALDAAGRLDHPPVGEPEPWQPQREGPRYEAHTTVYCVVDPRSGAPMAPVPVSAHHGRRFDPHGLDADRLRAMVLRYRGPELH
jgi:hypothetical protein